MKVAKKKVSLLAVLLVSGSVATQQAQAVWWASEPTQMMNNIALLISNIADNAYQYMDMAETMQRRIREIEQIRVATQNFRNMSPDSIRNLANLIKELTAQRAELETIVNCNTAIDAAIRAQYPGYKEYIEGNGQNADYFQKNYLVLKQTVNKEITNTLKNIQISGQQLGPELVRRGEDLEKKLVAALEDENSQQQVAGAVAQLAVLQFRELEEIRNLTALQSGAVMAGNAKVEMEKAAEQRTKERERRAVNRFFGTSEGALDQKYHMDQVEDPKPR